MFTFKVTKFQLPELTYYNVEVRLPEEVKTAIGYDKYFSMLYGLGDDLFGEDHQSSFSSFAVYYELTEEFAPDWVKVMGEADNAVYELLRK